MSDEITAAINEIREFTGQLQQETAAGTAALAAQTENEDEVKARRSGERGTAWQRVQQSIDLGRTTLADVVNGTDPSEAAREVRALMARQLGPMRGAYVAAMESDDLAAAVSEAKAAQHDLGAAVRRLASGGLG